MDFKKKAGLALALAAIFTTGGANLALAACSGENTTCPVDSNEPVNAPGKDLDASEVAPVAGNVALTGTLVGKTLAVDDAATKVTVTNLTISGTGSGALVNGAALETVAVVSSGALKLGDATNSGAPAQQGGTLPDVSFAAAGTMDVNKGNFTLGDLAASAGKLELTLDTGSTLNVGGDLTLGAATASTIEIGQNTANGAATMTVSGTFTQGNGSIILDPIWAPGGTFSDAAFHKFANDKVTGAVVVGQNSRFTIGIDNTKWLNDVILQTGRAWADTDSHAGDTSFSSAFGLNQYATLIVGNSAGSLTVDNTKVALGSPTAGTVSFAEDSVFVINAGKLYKADGKSTIAAIGSDKAAASGDGDVTINNDAKLVLANAKAGSKVLVLENFDINGQYVVGTQTGWTWNSDSTKSNLIFDVPFLTGTISTTGPAGAGAADGAGDELYVTIAATSADDVRKAFPTMSNGMAGMVAELYNSQLNSTDDYLTDGTDKPNNAGIKFVSRAVSGTYNRAEAAAVLEGAAQIAVAAGVPAVTNNVITRISSLIVDHNNLLNETQPAYGNEPGKLGIWVNPFYATSDVDGMDAGRFESGYEMNYGGAAFGLDYNVNEAFRLGLAMNVGGGDTESNGDFNKTEADFDFFGVSLYGSYTNGAFGLTGDVGFTGVDSEIDQNVPASMLTGNLESNVDSDAFTVGLTGQYRFAASDNFNITPHLGLRYTKISVDDANVDLVSGDRVFDVATEDQNLFQIPVGVEFSSNIVTDGGWTVTPSADLGVLFTAGDTDVESRARISGTSFTGRTSADVNDSAAFQGRLGVKAAADNGLSLGLDYGILAGANQTDHQFSGMLRFEF